VARCAPGFLDPWDSGQCTNSGGPTHGGAVGPSLHALPLIMRVNNLREYGGLAGSAGHVYARYKQKLDTR